MGLDPRWPLTSGHQTDLVIYELIAVRAAELARLRDENLAILIANNVGKIFRK